MALFWSSGLSAIADFPSFLATEFALLKAPKERACTTRSPASFAVWQIREQILAFCHIRRTLVLLPLIDQENEYDLSQENDRGRATVHATKERNHEKIDGSLMEKKKKKLTMRRSTMKVENEQRTSREYEKSTISSTSNWESRYPSAALHSTFECGCTSSRISYFVA